MVQAHAPKVLVKNNKNALDDSDDISMLKQRGARPAGTPHNVIDLYRTRSGRIAVTRDAVLPSSGLRVLFATSELYPFVKTGGLGDVAASMPPALQKLGVDIRYFIPGYPAIKKNLKDKKTVHSFSDLFGHAGARLLFGTLPNGLKAYVLDAPSLYERAHPYLDEDRQDWPDNHIRFGAFCYVAAHLANYDPNWKPDIFHGNDWQCGLIPAYKAYHGVSPEARTIITIHNLAFQGLFPADRIGELALPPGHFTVNGYEYFNQIGFLKAGLFYSDHITTVSPTYAQEICTPILGFGLDGLLKGRRSRLSGVLNGIDETGWNPQTDAALRYNYSKRALASRKKNKKAFLKEMGLETKEDRLLIGFMGRFTEQKGIDLLLETIPEFLEKEDISFVILGAGESVYEDRCAELMQLYPGRFAYPGAEKSFNQDFTRRFYAGVDAITIPSRFEPCGMVQLFAMRYGALPIVRSTGGLADTVSEETGFLFNEATVAELKKALNEVIGTYYNETDVWKSMQRTAMKQDFSWGESGQAYLALYQAMVDSAPQPLPRQAFVF